MVAVQPVEDLKEMCQRLEEQEVEAQVGDRYRYRLSVRIAEVR